MRTLQTATGKTRRQGGFTMVEVMVASALLSLVLIGTVVLFSSACRLWRVGTSGTSANMYASIAVRKLVTEIQEGQSATQDGSRLLIQFPYYDVGSGSYQKNAPGDLAEYYLSGANGTETPVANGDNVLWKQVGDTRTRVVKNIRSFNFEIYNGTQVRLYIEGAHSENVVINPDLIRQSVTLRNK